MPPAAVTPVGPVPPESMRRNPWIAAFLSAIPGLGHIYNGLFHRGVAILGVALLWITLVSEVSVPAFGFALVFTWMFGLLDAYRQAVLINHGYSTDPWVGQQQRPLASGQEKLVVGILLFAGGFLEMLDRFGLFRWQQLFEYGFILFMILGAVLIVSSLKKKTNPGATEDI